MEDCTLSVFRMPAISIRRQIQLPLAPRWAEKAGVETAYIPGAPVWKACLEGLETRRRVAQIAAARDSLPPKMTQPQHNVMVS